MSVLIFVEGGGSKLLDQQCREGFRKLLEKCGFRGRLPRLFASGSRNAALDDFRLAHASKGTDFVALLIDSEEPVARPEATWNHLKARDGWARPSGATDDQVLFMTTCMETWIVADREALKAHYVRGFRESALPPLENLETRERHDVQDRLEKATRECANAYRKGRRSFEVPAKLNPDTMEKHLPSFKRARRFLAEKL